MQSWHVCVLAQELGCDDGATCAGRLRESVAVLACRDGVRDAAVRNEKKILKNEIVNARRREDTAKATCKELRAKVKLLQQQLRRMEDGRAYWRRRGMELRRDLAASERKCEQLCADVSLLLDERSSAHAEYVNRLNKSA